MLYLEDYLEREVDADLIIDDVSIALGHSSSHRTTSSGFARSFHGNERNGSQSAKYDYARTWPVFF